ncbi:MAG TPA: aminotransferase class I/II-fold pyridoxal phosphate-dependent enzyme [Bryobacteraceae bacterium]|nr:aminotransferase class I/II-fold pyridoxal phosphate-dependent enzyme [Bryobacteraceae bacterium]
MEAPEQSAVAVRERARFHSVRTERFSESVIREMTRLAARLEAVNLAQGFPDFPAPEALKQAASEALFADINQYAVTWGAKPLRDAIAHKYARWYGLEYDPEREVTVCCGSTEGMIASLLAVTTPGDEIVVFEPFYENYRPDALLCGAEARLVTLHAPEWRFDPDELRRAFSARTKAIILNTPNNPTGKVFTRDELSFIAGLCQEFDALAITDEIYEHIVYDGARHVTMASLPGMRDRTIVVNSMSKTYSVTGWRVGWVMAPADIATSVRKVHDFLTVGAAAPLQQAGAVALASPDEYYEKLARDYAARRDVLLAELRAAGFAPQVPRGAYYIMCDIAPFGFRDDVAFVRHMIEQAGVAAVPGSSFFDDPARGAGLVRFCFCKKRETLLEAGRRLRTLKLKA